MPKLNGVIESSLYVEDLERAVEFYQRLFAFAIIGRDARFCAFNVSNHHVLLLFKRGASDQSIPLPGGSIPPHDGAGSLHVGFAVPADSLPEWEQALAANHVTIESRVKWPRGGASVYFRDPDRHLLELLTPGVWTIY
jgi:catechol 2,3-dioxygenase-like lactoylglutathione lyase family enzyme